MADLPWNQTKPNQTKPNQTKSNQTNLNQTKPNQNQTKLNQIKPNQPKTKPNQTKPNQTKSNQTNNIQDCRLWCTWYLTVLFFKDLRQILLVCIISAVDNDVLPERCKFARLKELDLSSNFSLWSERRNIFMFFKRIYKLFQPKLKLFSQIPFCR